MLENPIGSEALDAVVKIRDGRQVAALGVSMKFEIDGVWELLNNLNMQVGPKREAAADASSFFKLVLTRVAMYCTHARHEGTETTPNLSKGPDAAKALHLDVKTMMEANVRGRIVMQHLGQLKAFSWLLTDVQFREVKTWIAENGAAMANAGRAAIANCSGEDAVLATRKSTSASSSSKEPTCALAAQAAKGDKTGTDKKQAAKANIMDKFFLVLAGACRSRRVRGPPSFESKSCVAMLLVVIAAPP